MAQLNSGYVTGFYQTRGGETVYLIAWDDRRARLPVELQSHAEIRVGQRVRLEGGALHPEQEGAPA